MHTACAAVSCARLLLPALLDTGSLCGLMLLLVCSMCAYMQATWLSVPPCPLLCCGAGLTQSLRRGASTMSVTAAMLLSWLVMQDRPVELPDTPRIMGSMLLTAQHGSQ